MKKIIATIIGIIMAMSMMLPASAQATIVAGDTNIYKSFGFGSSDTPTWSWFMGVGNPGTDQGASIKYANESDQNSNGVVKFVAKGGNWSSSGTLKRHTFNFSINGNGYYTFTTPYAVSVDVKINSITSGYNDYDQSSSAPGVFFPCFKIGGDTPNYPSTNNKPRTAGVYKNKDGTLKISAIHNPPEGVTQYDEMDIELGQWYTLKTYFDPVNNSTSSYAINKETGEKKLITVDTKFDPEGENVDKYKVGVFSLNAFGEAEYMIDNLCYYSSHQGINAGIDVQSFTSDNGLVANVSLTDNTKTAKIFVDGVEKASFEKGAVFDYTVTIPGEDVPFDGLKKREIKLVCYDASGNIADEVIESAAHRGTYRNKIASSWTGANESNTIEVGAEHNITGSNNLSKYNLKTEVEYKFMLPEGVNKFFQYELTYKSDYSASEWLTQTFVDDGKLKFGSQEAYTPNVWYTVKIVYDFPAGKIDTYIGEEGGEQVHIQTATEKREVYGTQWDWGLARVILKYTVNDGVTEKAKYRHVYFHRYDPVELPQIASYVAADDTTTACTDNKVPADAKSFTINTELFGNITSDNTAFYKNGNVVEDAGIVFDADAKTLTVTPPQGVTFDDNCKVVIGESATVNGTATGFVTTVDVERTDEFAITSDISVVKTSDGTYSAEVSYYNREDKVESALFMIASYSGDRMTSILFKTCPIESDGANTLRINLTGVTAGERVSAMLWSNLTSFSPITGEGTTIAE